LAYHGIDHQSSWVGLFEGLIIQQLIAQRPLVALMDKIPMIFALAPQQSVSSPLWQAHIIQTAQFIFAQPAESYPLHATRFSIESLYHQEDWLNGTMVLAKHPVSLEGQTAVQALEDILERHIKAADKRLRPDQLEKIFIFAPTNIHIQKLRRYLAELVVRYPNMNQDISLDLLHQTEKKILIIEESQRWKSYFQRFSQTFGEVCRTAQPQEYRTWVEKKTESWLRSFLFSSFSNRQNRIREFSFLFPVSVELYTTRGGCWKSSQEIAKGLHQET